MEPLVYFVMSNGTTVITALLGAIILCVFSLMIMSFHNPQQSIANEVGTVDRLEGVLRRILSEQDWPHVKVGDMDAEQVSLLTSQIESLEGEIREKQKEIERLQEGGRSEGGGAEKIRDLEEKLAEYAVIEEDIADLSKFRQENDELKKRLAQLTGIKEEETASMPWDEFEQVIKSKNVESAKESVETSVNNNNS